MDAVTKTVIHPRRIRGNRLSSFMEAYLSRCDKRGLFDDAAFFEGCRRLSTMVGERDTTVLLAKLYAEQMVAANEGQAGEELPESIPDLMLEYLNRINRKDSGMADRAVHASAKTLAWECLRESFRPVPADINAALESLKPDAEPRLRYLQDKLRLIETIGVERNRIRFALDPLAEYLAGLYLVEHSGDNEDAWREFLTKADGMPGASEAIKGFLLAVRDCCLAREAKLKVPAFVAVELARMGGWIPE